MRVEAELIGATEFILGPTNHDISAADEIWIFFRRHARGR